jgi:hypothetical protein
VSIQGNLQRMIEAIDTTSLTRQQKLRLFRFGVCPRLSWPLMIEEFPISWLERELQPIATRALKKWSASSNTSILFLPANRGGLALPSLVTLYKRMQATRMVQLFTSRDQSVRKAAELHLEEERKSLRAKYRPAEFVDNLLSSDQFTNQRTVARAAKTIITEEDADERHQSLCQLPAQGGMARSWEETSPELWVRTVHRASQVRTECLSWHSPHQCKPPHLGQEDQRHLQPVQGPSAVSRSYFKQLPGCDGTSEVQSET